MSFARARPSTILVVEDDHDTAGAMREVLQDDGCEVVVRRTAIDALDVLAQRPLPSLIVLDLALPGMHGVEFARRVQANPDLARVPLMVVSAVPLLDQARDVQAVAYLEKPIDPERLLRLVRTHDARRSRSGKKPR